MIPKGGGIVNAWTDPELVDRRERLLDILRSYGRLAVAYSGGVDSAGRGQGRARRPGRRDDRRHGGLGEPRAGRAGRGRRTGQEDRDRPPDHPDRGVRRPELPPEQLRPLLLLQERALRPAREPEGRPGGRDDRLGREHGRPGGPPAGHEGGGRARRPPPAPGGRPDQGPRPPAGQGLGPPHLGQAGDPLPVEPDRLRRGRHARSASG